MKGVKPFAEKMIELIILLQFPNLMKTSWERGCRKACTFQKKYPVPCEVAYCHKTACHVWLVQFLRKPLAVIFQRIWSSSSFVLFSCITILQSITFSQIDSRSMRAPIENCGSLGDILYQK